MDRLSSADKILCAVYGVVGVVALVWTQVVLVQWLRTDERSLVDDVTANWAATFTTIDLLAVALVGLVFIVVEGRRLGMRFIWVYIVITFAVAISVALPLFLIVRQFRLAGQRMTAAV